MTTTQEGMASTPAATATRILREGYGPGAWHGPDLKAALSDVPRALAFSRPAAGRHNIAEIALHHAFCVRNMRSQLSARPAEPFIVPGDDWFVIPDESTVTWDAIVATVDAEQRRLGELVAALESGAASSPLEHDEQFGLVLGITAHAIYHAGQIQLIRRLAAAA